MQTLRKQNPDWLMIEADQSDSGSSLFILALTNDEAQKA